MTSEPATVSAIRVVFDTNVVVSAVLLSRGIPRRAFDIAKSKGRLLISEETLLELEEVLRRSKFDRYISAEERQDFLGALVCEAEVVPITQAITECRDPRDNKFLELAVDGRASHIISGDADLLSMHPFRGITVVPHRTSSAHCSHPPVKVG